MEKAKNSSVATASLLICALSLLAGLLVVQYFVNFGNKKMSKFEYPAPRRDETTVDKYFGTEIKDPYRWMEDPDAEETKQFVDAQNAVSKPYINACPVQEKIKARITQLWDYPKYGCPKKQGDHYYYFHNTGLQNQSVMYVQDNLEAEPRVFLDPNSLSEDGTISLRGTRFSENGAFFAYGLSDSGSDWVTIKFKKAPSGEDLPDVLKRIKFSSMSWTHDHKGFFYNRYPEEDGKSVGTDTTTNVNQKMYFHRLGTDQSEDVMVWECPEHPRWMSGAEVSDCGRYLLLTPSEGCDPINRLYMVDMESLEGGITGLLPYDKIVDNFDAEYEYVTNEGTVFTFKTNLNAPRYKLINIDITKPEQENWVTLVEEDEKAVLEWAACVHSKLILGYLRDVKSELYIHDLQTGDRRFQFPFGVGSIVAFSGKRKSTEIFYQFISFLTPGIIYRCDLTTDEYKPTVFREIKVKEFDASLYETKQVFFKSKDETEIPMFIVHKKNLVLDGNNPTLLYGYGGFSISITPGFSPSRIVFFQHFDGVYAIANIRGGGEYGETWHKNGTLGNKQNCFDDFQSAAEYLIHSKYTNSKRLAINGGSNGGLLVGASLNQRPDLFAAGIAQVGVLDMLRFHKFTIGHAWITDYGSSDDDKQFQWLIKYSPLHNIPKIPSDQSTASQYPALLLLTGDHDDRVSPLHSLKFIAELQHLNGKAENQTNPLIIRVDTKSGHGGGKPTAKVIEELTEIYSFLYQVINLQWSS